MAEVTDPAILRQFRAASQQSQPIPGGIVIKAADPTRPAQIRKTNNEAVASDVAPAMAGADLAGRTLTNQKIAKEIRDADRAPPPSGYRYNAAGNLEKIPGGPPDVGMKGISPEVRKDAIAGFQSADALARQIEEIKQTFQEGPGSTGGLSALLDYLPTTPNRVFNDAGNAARAFGGPVLGFTASQLNTEQEQQRAIGPYIPNSWDTDAQVLRKIGRLEGLVNQARSRSTQILGGIPDANGDIVPQKSGDQTPPGINPTTGPNSGLFSGAGSNLGGPTAGIATSGSYSTPDDIALQQRLEAAYRGGATFEELNAISQQAGRGGLAPEWQQAVQSRDAGRPYGPGMAPESGVLGGISGALTDLAGEDVATGIINAGNSVIPLSLLPGAADNTNQIISTLNDRNPKASLAGSVIGGVPAAAGAEILAAGRLPGALARFAPQVADAGYGAVQGFGNAQDGEGLSGAATGGLAGLIGGEAGRRVVGGLGSVIRGVATPARQYLRGEGVGMTGGQILGGTAKQIEDQLTGYPVIGGIIRNRRDEGLTDFNRAMFRQGAEGRPVQNIGERGAEELDQIVNQAYAPLDNVNMVADAQLAPDLQAAAQAGRAIPGRADDFNYVVNTRVGQNFGPNGELSGRNFQDAVRGLRQSGANQGMAAMHPGDFADALGGVENALTGLVQRQAPQAMDALNTGNRIYRNQAIIDEAVKAARNQRGPDGDALVMPSQLNTAATSNTNRFGGRSRAATTDRPFYELATAGQEVLPSKVGDSGTAGRLATLGALGLAGGGGAGLGYSEGDLTGAGAGGVGGILSLAALASLGGSRPAQQALARVLLDRPDIVRRAGTRLIDNANIGGIIGAPVAFGLLGRE